MPVGRPRWLGIYPHKTINTENFGYFLHMCSKPNPDHQFQSSNVLSPTELLSQYCVVSTFRYTTVTLMMNKSAAFAFLV
jgi:hypothetical protein